MAQEPFQIAILTQTAHNIIADRIATGTKIPDIKYFIPAYDEAVLVKVDDKVTGVTIPKSDPVTLDNIASTRLKMSDGTPEGEIDFVANFNPEDITRTLADGTNPATLRIRIKKEVNEYDIGGEANIFYICDELNQVWITIHITPHAFTAGQKWEIITDTGFANDSPIDNLTVEDSKFEFKLASEVLLPKVIIGTDQDKTSGKAGYSIADFENSVSPITIENQRVVFLRNLAPLTMNVAKTANNLEFSMETPESVLPLASHTLALTGDNIRGHLRVSGALDNSIVLSGTRYNLTINSDNDNCIDASSAEGLIVHNGKYTGTPTVPTAADGNSTAQIANTEFVQNQLAFYNVLRIKGPHDASDNKDYPAANAGDFYVVTESGKLGGASGVSVEPQDTMLCIVDNSPEGNHESVGNNWILGQVNTDMDLEGVIRDHLAEKNIVRLKGAIDASTEPAPDYPSANAGDMWVIEKAGRIGGDSGPNVEKNDTIMCLKDEEDPGDNAGSHAAVGENWMIGQVSTDLELGTAFSSYLTIEKLDHGWTNADIGKMVIKEVGVGEQGAFLPANADNVTSAEVVGHISRIDSSSKFTINRIGHLKRLSTEWQALCGETLVEGDVYFLNTSGGSFYTKDTSHFLPGNIDMPAFIALSDTDVWYYGYRGAEVGGGTSFGTSFAATDFSGNKITITHGLNTKRPIIRVYDENDQPVEAIQSRPTIGNELNAQDITFSDEMIAEMQSFLWHLIVIGTGVPYTTKPEVLEYEPVAQQHGVKVLPNGAIYSFDDWQGVEGFLTGDHGFVVPYKQSLSNVFTGFEVVGWEGSTNSKKIQLTGTPGLQWIKNRGVTRDHVLGGNMLDMNSFWSSNTTNPLFRDLDSRTFLDFYKDGYKIGDAYVVSEINHSIISWNWHYPMAKAWHAPGEGSRKVPTPWGMVDSVESNVNSGLTGDQVITELYNPLTGNGCLLYLGNGANRTLNISGGIAPSWMITKNLTGEYAPLCYHSQLRGGINPEEYYIALQSSGQEAGPAPTAWNNVTPTSSLISLGSNPNLNCLSYLCIIYYFSPLPGLQNFGGYAGNSGIKTISSGCRDGMVFSKIRSGGNGNWNIVDEIRGTEKRLLWNSDTSDIETGDYVFTFETPSGYTVSNDTGGGFNFVGNDYIYGHFGNQLIPQGNFDVYPSDPILANGSNSKVRITFEYKGSAILNSELLVYATREATPNWVQGTLAKITDLADGYQLLSADIDISSNANDTHMRWRLASNEITHTEHNIKNLKITWS